MKDAKTLIDSLQEKNKNMSFNIVNKPDKVKIKFKTNIMGWLGWFVVPRVFQKKIK